MKTCVKWCFMAMIVFGLVGSVQVFGADFKAYYTKIESGQAFERHSRIGPYADVVVDLANGQCVFRRLSHTDHLGKP